MKIIFDGIKNPRASASQRRGNVRFLEPHLLNPFEKSFTFSVN